MRRVLPLVVICGLVACIDFEADRAKCRKDGRCGAIDGGGTGGFSGDGGVGGGAVGGSGGGLAGGAGGSGGAGGGAPDDAGVDGGTDGGPDGGTDAGCVPGFHDDCGVGACRNTIPACVPDSDTTSCTPGIPGLETCNLVDDDCNGRVDDGDQSCGIGACARTVPKCASGTGNVCTPGTPASMEICNGLDDDCTGVAEQGKWLKDLFVVGTRLDVAISCMTASLPSMNDVRIADQGGPNCMTTACGRLNGQCNAMDLPVPVTVLVTAVQHTFPDAGQAAVALTLRITTPPIYVGFTSSLCIFGDNQCSYSVDSVLSAPATSTALASIQGSSDGGLPNLVALKLTGLQGTQVCGSSGASAPPQCLAITDVDGDGLNLCGDTACNTAAADPLKTFILNVIGSMLQTKIRDVIETQVCEPCGTGVRACPP